MSGVQAFAHARSAARKLYEEPTPAMLPRAIHSRRGNKSVNNNHGTTCHQTHDHSGRVVTFARIQYGGLFLQNIMAHTTLAGLVMACRPPLEELEESKPREGHNSYRSEHCTARALYLA